MEMPDLRRNYQSDAKNHLTLEFLKDLGIEGIKRASVRLSDIDVAASERNQARLSHVRIPEAISRYMELARQGIEAPAIIVKPGAGGWVIGDGNQRRAAYELLGIPNIDAFTVECTKTQWKEIISQANLIAHGFTASEEDLLAQGVAEHFETQGNVKAIAEKLALPYTRLLTAVNIKKVEDRLYALGVKHNLRGHELRSLNRIAEDTVLAAIVTLKNDAGRGSEWLKETVTECNKRKRNTAAQMQFLEEQRTLLAPQIQATAKGHRPPPDIWAKRVKWAQSVIRSGESEEVSASELASTDRELMREKFQDAAAIFTSWASGL